MLGLFAPDCARENYDRVIKRLVEAAASLRVGNPEDPGITIGPVIDETAYRRMLETIEVGKQEATLAFQGKAPPEGFFIPPTIFTNVKPHMRLSCEEIFGPVLSVLKVRDLDEAIRVANDTDYALTAGFFSRSPANIERVKAELVAGNVYQSLVPARGRPASVRRIQDVRRERRRGVIC